MSERRGQELVPALDGLRAIAILLVLGRHATRVFPDGTPFAPIAGWEAFTPLLNGWMGVDLFFVLSGFLIARHLLGRWDVEPEPLRRYALRRTLRIVPAYYTCLALVVAGAFPGYTFSRADLADRVAYHFLFMQDYFLADIVVAFWSLGVEAKFYLAAPLALIPLRRSPRGVRLAVLGLLAGAPLLFRAVIYATGEPVASYTDLFLTLRSPFHVSCDGLWLGAFVAVLTERTPGWLATRGRVLAGGGVLLSAVLLAAHPWLHSIGWFTATLLGSLVATGFAAWVGGVVLDPEGPLAPRAQWLSFVARISYSLYLVHLPLVAPVHAGLSRWPWYASLPPGAALLVSGPLYSAAGLVVAWLLYRAVEAPFLRWKASLG